MAVLMIQQNGMPYLIDSDDLPSTDGNRGKERIIEIAAALEREGYEGIRVQCVAVDGGHYVNTLNLLQGSFGARAVEFFADYARKHKTIFSVEVALQLVKQMHEVEVRNG